MTNESIINQTIINDAAEIDTIDNVKKDAEMTNENNIQNTNLIDVEVKWISDPQVRKETEAKMNAVGLNPVWVGQPKIKSVIKYNEEGKAVCPVCGKEFDVNELNEEDQMKAHKTGMCLTCLGQFEKMSALMGKSFKISGGTREIKNGGQNAGKRIRAAFELALNSGRLNDEIIENMLLKQWSRDHLKISGYAFLKEVTDFTIEEIKAAKTEDDSKGKVRYLSTVYSYNNRSFLMTNALFTHQLDAIEKEFKQLRLIDSNYQI